MSRRFAIACVVCLVVFLLSSIVLTRDFREATSTYNMNRVMHRNELHQRTEVMSLGRGVMVDRPLNVMNILVRGLTPELTEKWSAAGVYSLQTETLEVRLRRSLPTPARSRSW